MNYREQYERWLDMFKDDKATYDELIALKDEQEIEDRFYTSLKFGTAGMRGVLGAGLNRMNVYNVRRATAALAMYILTQPQNAQRGVAIAYDSRRNSDLFAKQAALTLCARGVKVYLFDSLRPVPELSFTVRYLNCIAGIVVTASHNPAEYNGYKVYWEDGGQVSPEIASQITRLIDTIDYPEALPMDEDEAVSKGLLNIIGAQIDDAYISAVKKLCVNPQLAREMGGQLKIVYTPLHGSGNIPVRRILKEIGFKQVYVVPEQELPDPNFSTVRLPNPEDPAAFTLALKLQEKLDADVVFGTDPDCDRVGIAVKDKMGQTHILTGNQTGCLLLDYILSQKQAQGKLPSDGAAVKSIVTTEMARAICRKFSVKLFDVLTGFKFIAEMIHRFETDHDHEFLFGFEESYGYLSGTDVRDKDGVNACMLIAETAAWYKKRGMTLYEALNDLFEKYGHYGERVKSVTLKGKDGLDKMSAIMTRLRVNPPERFGSFEVVASRDYQSGIRDEHGVKSHLGLPVSNVLYYELTNKAWICIRPSGTEPKIKLYVNAVSKSAEQTNKYLDELMNSAEELVAE
ncbi:MAG: phospho-sugar mutase [Clostridia bacterium]|nr:phospho-sugar mutase [Clostridia bacterium]